MLHLTSVRCDAFELFLARDAGRRIRERPQPLRRNRRSAARADAILAVLQAGQRDPQAASALGQPRGDDARQLLLLDALGDIEEVPPPASAAVGISASFCSRCSMPSSCAVSRPRADVSVLALIVSMSPTSCVLCA
jgi:hypothetical protein